MLNAMPGVNVHSPEATFYLFPEVTGAMKAKGIDDLAVFAEQALHATGVSFCTRRHFGRPQPGETEQVLVRGWLRTGDVASITPNGYVMISDRAKDVIKSGGEWVSSVDLENTIMGHPAVLEAAVIGVPDPKWGELIAAVVVVRDGTITWLTEAETLPSRFASPG